MDNWFARRLVAEGDVIKGIYTRYTRERLVKDVILRATGCTEDFFRGDKDYTECVGAIVDIAKHSPESAIDTMMEIYDIMGVFGGTAADMVRRAFQFLNQSGPKDKNENSGSSKLGKFTCQCDQPESDFNLDLTTCLFFMDCLVQIMSFMTTTIGKTLADKIWKLCTMMCEHWDLESHDPVTNDLQYLILKQASVAVSFLTTDFDMWSSIFTYFTRDVLGNRRAVYIMYRFFRLYDFDDPLVSNDLITSFLGDVLRKGEQLLKNDSKFINDWIILASNLIQQIDRISGDNKIQKLLGDFYELASKAQSKHVPMAMTLMPIIVCRQSEDKIEKFTKDMLANPKIYKSEESRKDALNAFLIMLRGRNMSRANQFWDWGNSNGSYEHAIEVTWTSNAQFDAGILQKFKHEDDPLTIRDILLTLYARGIVNFDITECDNDSMIMNYALLSSVAYLKRNAQRGLLTRLTSHVCGDAGKGLLEMYRKLEETEFKMKIKNTINTMIAKRNMLEMKRERALCYETMDHLQLESILFGDQTGVRFLITLIDKSESMKKRIAQAQKDVSKLTASVNVDRLDADISVNTAMSRQIPANVMCDIEVMSYIWIMVTNDDQSWIDTLIKLLLHTSLHVSYYAAMWLNYFYITERSHRENILTKLIKQSAIICNAIHSFILLHMTAKLLDLNMCYYTLPEELMGYIVIALASPVPENRDLVLSVIRRLKVGKKDDSLDWLRKDNKRLAGIFRRSFPQLYEMNLVPADKFVSLESAACCSVPRVWQTYLCLIAESVTLPVEFITCLTNCYQKLSENTKQIPEEGTINCSDMNQFYRIWVEQLCILGLSTKISQPERTDALLNQIFSIISEYQMYHVCDYANANKHDCENKIAKKLMYALDAIETCQKKETKETLAEKLIIMRAMVHIGMNCNAIPELCLKRVLVEIRDTTKYFMMKKILRSHDYVQKNAIEKYDGIRGKLVNLYATIVWSLGELLDDRRMIGTGGVPFWMPNEKIAVWKIADRQEIAQRLLNGTMESETKDNCSLALVRILTCGALFVPNSVFTMDTKMSRVILLLEKSGHDVMSPLLYHHVETMLPTYITYSYEGTPAVASMFFRALCNLFHGDYDGRMVCDTNITHAIDILFNGKEKHIVRLIALSLLFMNNRNDELGHMAFRMFKRLIIMSHFLFNLEPHTIDEEIVTEIDKCGGVFIFGWQTTSEQQITKLAECVGKYCKKYVEWLIDEYLNMLESCAEGSTFSVNHRYWAICILDVILEKKDFDAAIIRRIIKIFPRIPENLHPRYIGLLKGDDREMAVLIENLYNSKTSGYASKIIIGLITQKSPQYIETLLKMLCSHFTSTNWNERMNPVGGMRDFASSSDIIAHTIMGVMLTTMHSVDKEDGWKLYAYCKIRDSFYNHSGIHNLTVLLDHRLDKSGYTESMCRELLIWATECKDLKFASEAGKVMLKILEDSTGFADSSIIDKLMNKLSEYNNIDMIKAPGAREFVISLLRVANQYLKLNPTGCTVDLFHVVFKILDYDKPADAISKVDSLRQQALNVMTRYLRNPREGDEIDTDKIIQKFALLLMKDGFENAHYASILALCSYKPEKFADIIAVLLPTLYTIYASIYNKQPYSLDVPRNECINMLTVLKELTRDVSDSDDAISALKRSIWKEANINEATASDGAGAHIMQLVVCFKNIYGENDYRVLVERYCSMIHLADVNHKRAVYKIAGLFINSITKEHAQLFAPITGLAAMECCKATLSHKFLELYISKTSAFDISVEYFPVKPIPERRRISQIEEHPVKPVVEAPVAPADVPIIEKEDISINTSPQKADARRLLFRSVIALPSKKTKESIVICSRSHRQIRFSRFFEEEGS